MEIVPVKLIVNHEHKEPSERYIKLPVQDHTDMPVVLFDKFTNEVYAISDVYNNPRERTYIKTTFQQIRG